MFDLCLFDLDQTLLDTADMADLRDAGKNRADDTYIAQVKRVFNRSTERLIYSELLLINIKASFPEMKLGVFTRSPRSYASTILSSAYPSIKWDQIVAFEDVKKTKPYGEGIDKAMFAEGYKNITRVALVGDGDSDVRAAYNAGCVVVLDKSSWGRKLTPDNWRSLAHIPDAVIESPEEIIDVLADYRASLPELERLLSGTKKKNGSARFDRVNKFIPKELGGDNTAFPVFCCGRSFAGYSSLEWKAKWHKLTISIQNNKDVIVFPDEWILAVRSFITNYYRPMFFRGALTVAVVPHRPGRTPRLEAFLAQLEASFVASPLPGRLALSFVPDLLAYKEGVRSNSNDKLGAKERFENIRDHLYVKRSKIAERAKILVIDDVSTTGSSLIYAKKYLDEAGAADVTCLTIAMNISNVLYD